MSLQAIAPSLSELVEEGSLLLAIAAGSRK